MLPVAFIPTPRRLLLAILLILSILVFFAGVRSRALVLLHPASPNYLHWYTSETSLSMIFANLPFLTSLVVATAPSRMRYFSHNLRHSGSIGALPTWPRSRLGSLNNSEFRGWEGHTEIKSRLDLDRSHYSGKTSPELHSPVDVEKEAQWDANDQVVQEKDVVCRTPSLTHSVNHKKTQSNDESSFSASSPLSSPEPAIIARRKSLLPKMRLSGGLAEMGDISIVLSEEDEEFLHS